MPSLCEKLHHYSLERPQHTAVSDETRELSYFELWQNISGFAGWLLDRGLKKGEPVLCQATNSAEFLISYYGIQYAEGIAVPVDKQVLPDNVRAILAETGARYLVSAKAADVPCQIVDAKDIFRLAAPYAGTALPFPESTQPADLIFTTGTTGKAKGVLTSHGAIYQVADDQLTTSQAEPNTVYMVYGPVSHVNALRKTDAALYGGFTLVFFDGLVRAKKFFQTIEEKHVTATHLLPSAARMLLTLSGDRLGQYASQLTYIDSGASAYPDADRERVLAMLPNTRLYYAYGASEVFCIGKYEFSKYPGRSSCVGQPTPGGRAFIVDEMRQPKPNATLEDPGFIAYESKTHMIGYWHEPELTAGVLEGDTVYTNDLGYIDSEGFIYVLGRKGDVINVGGIKVSAQELEALALKYPGVAMAACIPLEDKLHGQVPQLFLEMAPGATYNAAEFKAFLSSTMENYKLPRRVTVLEAIPMLGVKVDRKKLATM